MDSLMTFGVVLSAIDHFSKPLAEIGNSVGAIGKKLNNTKIDKFNKEIEDITKKLDRFSKLKISLSDKFKSTTNTINKLKKELNNTDKTLQKLAKEKITLEKQFKAGKISAKEFDKEIKSIDTSISKLKSKKIGIDKELSDLTSKAEQTKSSIKRVDKQIDILNSKKLKLSTEFKKTKDEIEQSEASLNSFLLKLSSVSAVAVSIGKSVGGSLLGFVKDYKEVEKAQGDIASLGISDSGIKAITKAAKEMSNQFAGVTAPEFIKASYDIKSGIASLSDEGVAKYTKFAATTAAATKSTTATMTKLFALGHGIFKSANESDIEFGKRFAASIGRAVKAFRTDGEDLERGISNIGATAKSMGVSLAEELAIIGKAKDAFSSAAEAGTGYRAFLAGAVNAQDELKMSFVDTEGKLLPMYQILEKIKNKFGDVIDANETAKLKKAFGSEEAVKIITALLDKTKELKDAQKDLMSADYSDTVAMAKARNRGQEFTIFAQRVSNLAATFGQVLAPAVDWISGKIGKFAIFIDGFVKANPWAKYAIWAVAGLSVIAVALGSVGLALGALSFAVGALGSVMAVVFSPITAIVLGLATAVFVVIAYWDDLVQWFSGFWNWIGGLFNAGVSYITSIFTYPIGLVSSAWNSLASWFGTFWNWIGGVFNAGATYIANVFVTPIAWIRKMWGKLLDWINKKVTAIKGMVNSVANFLGMDKVFDVNVNASGGKGIGKEKYNPKVALSLKKIEPLGKLEKTTSKLKDAVLPLKKAAPYIPKIKNKKKHLKHKKHQGNKHHHSSSSNNSANSYSSSVGGKSGGNTYNINITVNGTPNEISNKLQSILPSLIQDLEENILGRAMYDL